jgi:hypothetical protein
MLPASRAQKLSLQINVELVGSQEVFGRQRTESPRSRTLSTYGGVPRTSAIWVN